jgi:hypothetical protein
VLDIPALLVEVPSLNRHLAKSFADGAERLVGGGEHNLEVIGGHRR